MGRRGGRQGLRLRGRVSCGNRGYWRLDSGCRSRGGGCKTVGGRSGAELTTTPEVVSSFKCCSNCKAQTAN